MQGISVCWFYILQLYYSHRLALVIFWWSLKGFLCRGSCHLQTVRVLLLLFQFGFLEAGRTPAQRAAAKRSYPTAEVRGSGWECQAATSQEQPRGATPRLRSGATAERSYTANDVRGHGWEDQPHVQGAVVAWAQEGLEELCHVEGQEGWWWGDTLHPR